MKLNQLRDNKGAHKARMRVGRGIGSGKGKTSGRGVKGQTSRSGVAIKGFEGGQMPIHMRLPKRGFNVPNPLRLNAVNLGRLQVAIDSGKLEKGSKVTAEALVAAGVIRRKQDGVRILGKGALKDKLDFEVAGVSAGARAAIEKLGGEIIVNVPRPKAPPKDKSKSKAKSKVKAEVKEAVPEAAPEVAKDEPEA